MLRTRYIGSLSATVNLGVALHLIVDSFLRSFATGLMEAMYLLVRDSTNYPTI
jgi:hypothetical protein